MNTDYQVTNEEIDEYIASNWEEFITDALAQCPGSRFFGKTIGCTDKFLDAFIKFPAQFRCDRCIVKDLIQRIDKQFDAMV